MDVSNVVANFKETCCQSGVSNCSHDTDVQGVSSRQLELLGNWNDIVTISMANLLLQGCN